MTTPPLISMTTTASLSTYGIAGPVTLSHRSGYAWQVGVGGIWNVSERVAVDAS